MKEDTAYTQVQEPLTVRRSVLEAALHSTEILKAFENIKNISAEKDAYKKKFKTIISQIKTLNNRITKEFPELPKEVNPKVEIVKIKPTKLKVYTQNKENIIMPVEKSKLDLELADIKSKLENLKI